jgi:hypothetical protein
MSVELPLPVENGLSLLVGCRTVPEVVELLAALFSETDVLADVTADDFRQFRADCARELSPEEAASSSNIDALGIPPSGCRPGVSLRWDLPAGEMSRMALGGFGLEVDPNVVWKSQSRRSHRASPIGRMRLTGLPECGQHYGWSRARRPHASGPPSGPLPERGP